MYSIIETGGSQHKVSLGTIFRIPQTSGEVGAEIEFDKVLMVSTGKEVSVGSPQLADSAVKAEVLSHGRDKTVVVFKKKRRQGYRKTRGHRQNFTELVVTEIKSGSESVLVDKGVVERARARAVAIAKRKEQNVRLTLKQKREQGIAKPEKVKKNSLRKGA